MSDETTELHPYLDELSGCIRAGWVAWEDLGTREPGLRLPLGPRTRACFVYEHVVFAIRQRFTNRPGVHINERRGFLELLIGSKYLIRFKKLNKNLQSSNIPTKQQKRWFDLQLELPDMPPQAMRLVAGYRLNLAGTEIEQLAITQPVGRKIRWALDISDRGFDESRVTSMPGVEPQPAEIRSTITETKKEEEIDDNK